MYGKGRHTDTAMSKMPISYFSVHFQQNYMRFGVSTTPNSNSLNLDLRLCSSFSFGVENVLVSRFDPPFKCTADKEL